MGDSKAYWVAFNRVHGIGAVRFAALLESFGTLENAWRASRQALLASGIGPQATQHVVEARRTLDPEAEMARLEGAGIQLITWEDESYPSRLREVPSAPPVLYLRGDILVADRTAVAVVGTRRPSPSELISNFISV